MKFGIVGTGNAAWHFSTMLKANGHEPLEVFGRDSERVSAFEKEFDFSRVSSPKNFSTELDLIILAVSDDAIVEVSRQIPTEILCVHTSGSAPMSALMQDRMGVVWPLQTLRKGVATNYSTIPLLMEGSDAATTEKLKAIFCPISSQVIETTSEQRATAHLAAVFANNFTNHLIEIAGGLAHSANMPFDILRPIVLEMATKLQHSMPHDVQTGPAIRRDESTISRHLEQLKGEPKLSHLYTLLTEHIIETFHGKKL